MLFMTCAALCIAGFAFATDEIGLYSDANHIGYTMGPNYTLYVFFHMVDHTVSACEFKLVFPPHASRGANNVVNGPNVMLNIPQPDIEHDMAFAFSDCFPDWREVCHMNVGTTPGGAGDVITVAEGDN